MTSPTATPSAIPTGSRRAGPAVRVPAWAWLLAALAMFAIYLVVQDTGQVLASASQYVHEFTHDGRHALGAPCH